MLTEYLQQKWLPSPVLFILMRRKILRRVIEKALELGGYKEDQVLTGINGGTKVTTGFGHAAILSHADTVIKAVKSGDISHFFLVAGCDGAKPGRNYYTEFVKQTPSDSIVLTLACGKFRFNDLNLGEIGGLPRLMDMGQCNDAYGAIQVAVALADAFGCSVNELAFLRSLLVRTEGRLHPVNTFASGYQKHPSWSFSSSVLIT